MKKRSGRPSGSLGEAWIALGQPVMQLEGLEDRRLMSVVTPAEPHSAVRIETNLGRITLLLTPDATPQTVANFLNNYVDKMLYDNTVVHRSVPGFIIQMGGYKFTSNYPHITQADPVVNEFEGAKAAAGGGEVNTRGTVAMAKLGSDPDSATSEFFINLADNSSNLDNQNGGFTTFARVIGGSMHVADAIAGLTIQNQSFLNSAFTDLPVIASATGQNPVVISSAKAQTSTVVRVGDSQTKYVTWIDEKGGRTTVTLSKGTADLTFVGGNDMRPDVKGNRIVITGKNVTLEELTTSGTNKSSVLSIKSNGGKAPAHIGNITVTGNNGLGRIDASSIQLQGDITATNAAISSINLQGTYRSTILTNGGQLSVRIGTAYDTSVNTSGTTNTVANPKGNIRSLVAGRWVDDGQLPTSIVTGSIGTMTLNGNVTSKVQVSGDAGQIKINGNVGTRGASTWTFGGSVKSVKAGKVQGLKLSAVGDLSSFRAREVLSSSDGTATIIAVRSIGQMNMATLTNQSSISATEGIQKVTIGGQMDSSTIRAGKNIGTVIAGSMSGNVPNSSGTALVSSGIYAGVVTTLSGLVTQDASFKNHNSTIGRLVVQKTFSNTSIAAPILGEINLGKVMTPSLSAFGVTGRDRIRNLSASVSGKTITLRGATSQEEVDSYLESKHLPTNPPSQQGQGYRFNVLIPAAPAT